MARDGFAPERCDGRCVKENYSEEWIGKQAYVSFPARAMDNQL